MKPAQAAVRRGQCLGGAVVMWAAVAAQAQTTSPPAAPKVPATPALVAFPYYHVGDVVQGLYARYLPQRAAAFEAAAQRLTAALQAQCNAPQAAPALQAQWRQTLVAWQALATPALGPVVTRRSQRAIDFWPTRPNLIEKAMARQPQTLAALEAIGTPAKGFPALEWLLQRPLNAASCGYAQLLSQEIEAEATALAAALRPDAALQATAPPTPAPAASASDGADAEVDADDPSGQARFSEWVNQWLAGWERLRWIEIEQPIQKARTRQAEPEFARQDRAANLAEWQAQWAALKVQAQLSAEQRQSPPQAAQGPIPIEALLLGKGQIALAARWAQALDKAGARITALPPNADTQTLMALAQDMKAVTTLFQNEVSVALDVPLGFSDADGD